MSVYESILLIFISILLQGFFSGSEFALVCADKRKLRQDSRDGKKLATRALRLLEKPEWFFSVTIICTNVCAVFTTTMSTFLIMDSLGPDYKFLTILFIPVILLVSEILPKTIYQIYATQLSPYVGSILLTISYLIYPFVYVLSVFGRFFLNRIGEERAEAPSREFLDTVIRESAGGRTVEEEESSIIQRIFDLTEKDVENMMVPLVNVVAVDENATIDEALVLFEEEEFTRLPVYKDKIIHLHGLISVLDLFSVSPHDLVKDHMHAIEYVPESMPSEDVFSRFKENEIRMAAVVDEYGGAVGIITLEDILEEIVGEISDEYDDDHHAQFKWISPSCVLVKSSMEVEALAEQLGIEVPSGDYETLGGYLLHEFEKIPRVGESLQRQSLTFVIRRASPRMIEEVEIIGAVHRT